MLPYILAIAITVSSLTLYFAAFFKPEVHRQDDFLWSGVGLFYALVLWICAPRITGGILLGQTAGVLLLLWYGWETLKLRKAIANPELAAEIENFSLIQWLQTRFNNLLPKSKSPVVSKGSDPTANLEELAETSTKTTLQSETPKTKDKSRSFTQIFSGITGIFSKSKTTESIQPEEEEDIFSDTVTVAESLQSVKETETPETSSDTITASEETETLETSFDTVTASEESKTPETSSDTITASEESKTPETSSDTITASEESKTPETSSDTITASEETETLETSFDTVTASEESKTPETSSDTITASEETETPETLSDTVTVVESPQSVKETETLETSSDTLTPSEEIETPETLSDTLTPSEESKTPETPSDNQNHNF